MSENEKQTKIILLVAGVVATLLSVIPDSAFMKMASENEKRLGNI